MLKKRDILLLIACFVLAVVLFLFNIFMGSVEIPMKNIIASLFGNSDNKVWHNIIMNSRMPQAITSVLAGAALAIGGLQMQTLFRNPLAGPSILGISSGASLGVAFVILASGNIGGIVLSNMGFLGNIAVTIAAFLGSVSILLLVIFLAGRVRGNATLLILGIMVGYTANSVVGMLKFYSVEEDVHAYVIWGLGSFAKVSSSNMPVFIGLICVGIVISFFLIKTLNLLMLGENYARNLGINVKRARLFIILSSGILTASVTAYCGPIIFIGLAVPHIARLLFMASDHRVLLPATALTGSCIALLCNLISRLPGFDGALPVNSVTSFIGAPVVIWVLLRKRKSEIVD